MRIHFWKGGCMWSIVLSIALTLVLNLAIRACSDDDDAAPAARSRADASSPAAPVLDPAVARFVTRVDSSVFTRWGACPFECCVYRDWVAEGSVLVRSEPRSRAPVIETIPAGDRFEADTGFVRITGPQIVIVTEPVEAYVHERGRRAAPTPDTLMPGDTLLVLEQLGEGFVMLTHGEDLVSASQFWPSNGWTPYTDMRGTTRGTHAAEWWAHVRTADGAEGWIDAYASELGNVDACG